jgi:hypothetical protein
MGTAILVLVVPAVGLATQTEFDFQGNLNAAHGPGTLSFANGTVTSSVVQFGSCTSFGIPTIGGNNATVMYLTVPFGDPGGLQQGFLFDTASGANGGGAMINQYTMVFDMLVPQITQVAPAGQTWWSFYSTNKGQTDITTASGFGGETDDSDLFLRGKTSTSQTPNQQRAIGTKGFYPDASSYIQDDTGMRIAITVSNVGAVGTAAAVTTVESYIDGTPVSVQNIYNNSTEANGDPTHSGSSTDTYTGLDGRWSLETTGSGIRTWLFADDSAESSTEAGYVSRFYFDDAVLSAAQIAAMGGPGQPIPEPSAVVLLGIGVIGLLTLARRRRAS